MTASRKRISGVAASVLFWMVIVGLLLSKVRRVDLGRAVEIAASRDVLPSVVTFAVFFLAAYGMRAVRFGYLVRTQAVIGWDVLLAGFPLLFFAGAVSPFRLGEAYRGVWVRKHADVSRQVLALWVGERLLDLLILLLMLIVGLGAVNVVDERVEQLLPVAAALLLSGYGAIWLGHRRVSLFVGRSGRLRSVGRFVEGLGYVNNRRLHGTVAIQTVLVWALMVAAFWGFLAQAPGLQSIEIRAAIALVAGVNVSSLFSVTPGNIGGFQAVFVLLTSSIHGDPTVLTGYAIVLQLTNLSIVALLAGLALLVPVFSDRHGSVAL